LNIRTIGVGKRGGHVPSPPAWKLSGQIWNISGHIWKYSSKPENEDLFWRTHYTCFEHSDRFFVPLKLFCSHTAMIKTDSNVGVVWLCATKCWPFYHVLCIVVLCFNLQTFKTAICCQNKHRL